MLVLGVPCAAAGTVAFLAGTGTAFWLALAGAALVGGLGFLRQQRRFRRYRCPTCRATLHREPGDPGAAITFGCRACDTEWDTGFREAVD